MNHGSVNWNGSTSGRGESIEWNPRKKRLCYLGDARSSHTAKWANHFSSKGYEVHILSFEEPRGISPAVNVHLLNARFASALRYFTSARQVQRILAEIRPGLLHAHYASGYGTLARMTNFHPYVVSTWGSDVFEFPARSPLHRVLIEKNLASADHVCSTSQFMADYVRRYYAAAITVTPFGVDCSKFKPMPVAANSEDVVIGTVKLLEQIYGLDDLIRSFALLVKEYGHLKKLRLVIAGEGSFKNQLQKLSADMGVEELTDFLGFVPQDQVPNVLNRFSVFVALSQSESFGVAVLEASACGLPVVVSNVGGFREVVQDQITGFIVARRDPKAVVAAIAPLIQDDERRKTMGFAGREFVSRNYEWTENADRMERLYLSFLESMPNREPVSIQAS